MTDAERIKELAMKELSFVATLIQEDDPDRYREIAAGLQKVGQRYGDLHQIQVEELQKRFNDVTADPTDEWAVPR